MISEQKKKPMVPGANLDASVLSAVLSVVQDGICFLSPDFNILYYNPAMQYWYETHESSLHGKCYEMYHSRNTPCENCPALRAMKSGKTEEQEVLYELNSRRSGWQKVFCSPVYDANGQITMIVEYIRD